LTQPVALDTPEGKHGAQQILVLGNLVARRYAAFAPELAQAAQGFLAQLQSQLMPDSENGSASGTSRTSSDSGDTTKRLTKEEFYEKNISELEDSADKESNAAFRKVAYVKAALATKPEDYIHAKRIAGKVDDDDLRADAVSFVLYRAALFFAEKGEIEKAIEIAPTISDISRRAVVKIAIAQRLLSSKSGKVEPGEVNFAQQRALDLLSDIDRDLKKADPSANAAKILLGRTAVLAKLDKDQALASLEQTVQMMNKLDRFDLRDGTAPNLGMGAFSVSGATVARPKVGFDFNSAIEPLIMTDFETLSAVAERLTVKELRGVGRLEVAKLYLRKNSESSRREAATAIR
jgi:tetratricopeptide (TPR) repeat protein